MATSSLIPDPKFTDALESLFDLGQAACDAIRAVQPDLVIGLAHSGWIPVAVARALWQTTERQPFPPCLRINLGLEKAGLFRDQRRTAGVGDYSANYSDAFRVAPLLVWVEDQLHWQAEMREMVGETIGKNQTPKHILVLDEMVSKGDTYLMTLSLLHAVYPNAEARFLAGRTTRANQLTNLWLAEAHPDLDQAALLKNDSRGLRQEGLKRIVVGTEDVAASSLRWRFVSESHPGLQSLSEVISMPDLLACRDWIEARVCQSAVERAQGRLSEPAVKQKSTWFPPHFYSIWPDLPPYKQLWQEGRMTALRWAEIRGCSLETAEQEIQTLVSPEEYLVPRGPGAPDWYIPYLLTDFDEPDFPHPLLDVYWAIPGRLLVGPTPAARGAARIAERLTWLAETGVTRILDLTEAADGLPHYEPYLNDSVMQLHPCPLARFRAPDVAIMRQMIDQLKDWLENDETVYLCDLNGAERAGMLLACLFIERGMTAQQAMEEVNRLRFETQITPALRCPESQEQWERVIGWAKRESLGL